MRDCADHCLWPLAVIIRHTLLWPLSTSHNHNFGQLEIRTAEFRIWKWVNMSAVRQINYLSTTEAEHLIMLMLDLSSGLILDLHCSATSPESDQQEGIMDGIVLHESCALMIATWYTSRRTNWTDGHAATVKLHSCIGTRCDRPGTIRWGVSWKEMQPVVPLDHRSLFEFE